MDFERISRSPDDEPPTPAEGLARLRELPRAQRQGALLEYKDFLDRQREALAVLYGDITKMLLENPETPYGELERKVEVSLERAHIDEHRAHGVYAALEAFDARREAILEYRRKFQNDDELYEAVFGAPPRGRVKVRTTPAILYFQCYDLEDYARIYLSDGAHDIEDSVKDANRLGEAARSSGLHLSNARDGRLSGAIAAEQIEVPDAKKPLAKALAEIEALVDPEHMAHHSRLTMLHEEQHAIHQLLINPMLGPESLGRSDRRSQAPERSQAFAHARESRAIWADDRARTEILAYYVEGKDREDIEKILFDKGNLYDYLTPEVCETIEEEVRQLHAVKDEEMVRLEAKDAISEYPAVVHEALEALGDLEKFYAEDVITAQLINEPLARWPKVARRLVESRLAREAVIKSAA